MILFLKDDNTVVASHANDTKNTLDNYNQATIIKYVPDSCKVDFETQLYDLSDCTFADLKLAKQTHIRKAYDDSESSLVNLHGFDWHSNSMSCLKLDGVLRRAVGKDESTVTFTDSLNRKRSLTIVQAQEIVESVTENQETRFMKKQDYMVEVDDVTSGDLDKLDAINPIF